MQKVEKIQYTRCSITDSTAKKGVISRKEKSFKNIKVILQKWRASKNIKMLKYCFRIRDR